MNDTDATMWLWGRPGRVALLGGAFALSYTQAPLYYSNQQQYFLHGLARAGLGHLDRDWLANTADPTPVFSTLVAAVAAASLEWLFYLMYAALQGVYFVSLWGLFRATAGPKLTPRREAAFLAMVFLVHAAIVRVASIKLLGNDYPWYFQSGLAGQYLLGPVFQPSTFGVLLVASLWAFVADRRFLAVTLAALGGVMHATYLPGSGLLVLAYLIVWANRGDWKASLGLGAWALLLVSPVVGYALLTFTPVSEAAAEARQILVHYRIPHHAVVRNWIDPIALAQIAWMVIGILLARGTRLFWVLAIPFVASAALTVVQAMTDSDALALVFPWRMSVLLVPAATAVILGRLATAGAGAGSTTRPGYGPGLLVGGVAALTAAAGVAVMAVPLGFHSPSEEEPLLAHVREHASPDDVYLIPVKPWTPSPPFSGSRKGDFKPAPEVRDDPRLIPIDLQGFRLSTGAPIFVDFKSIPYEASDVLEWRRRLTLNESFYEALVEGRYEDVLPALRERGLTHVVTRADLALDHAGLREEYADRAYRVYRIEMPTPDGQDQTPVRR